MNTNTNTNTTTPNIVLTADQKADMQNQGLGNDSVLLLYGGGIDSTALLHWLSGTAGRLGAVFFDYGQKANEHEREACEYFCTRYGAELFVLPLSMQFLAASAIMKGSDKVANDPKVNVLDGRNLMLISTAGVLAVEYGYNKLAVGFHQEPVARPFPDASPEFLASVNTTLKQSFIADLEVIAPFKDMSRQDIFALAEFSDKDILRRAHTCYEGVKGGCGTCSHCLLKASTTAALEIDLS